MQVECDDGKIVRIRPLHYDWKYPDVEPWKMEARGKTFTPSMESLIPPFTLGYKNRVYSPNRVLYPLKRVDWDPNGERNTQNRGKSKYERISWDEALDIVVSEINRIKDKYGMEAILSQSDGHGETAVIHLHTVYARLQHQRLYLQTLKTDSWEAWYWGAKHALGCESWVQMVPVTMSCGYPPRIPTHSLLGCDPDTTPRALRAACSRLSTDSPTSYQVHLHLPRTNYGAAVHAEKWVPVLPNTEAHSIYYAHVWLPRDLR